jgi:hypothetical protein
MNEEGTGRRGRPKTFGRKHPVEFMRAMLILQGFGISRVRGNKYEIALLDAVSFVKTEAPEMKASIATVKRVLKEFYPVSGRSGPSTDEIVRTGLRTWVIRRIPAAQS